MIIIWYSSLIFLSFGVLILSVVDPDPDPVYDLQLKCFKQKNQVYIFYRYEGPTSSIGEVSRPRERTSTFSKHELY
jgi:hypothetical protein